MVSLFTSQVPSTLDATDGVAYSLGTVFSSSAAGQVTHIRWRFPDTLPAGAVTGALFVWDSDATGTLLASAPFVAPVAGAWNTVAITPQVLTPDALYVAVVHTPDRYVATSGFFASAPLVSGVLTAPQDTPAVHNGKLGSGGALMYPDGSFGSASYFVDVVFVEDGGAVDVPVAQAPETDTAQPLGRVKAATLDTATETDTATPVGSAKSRAVGVAAETDTALPIGSAKSAPAGRAVETDTATPVTSAKARALSRAGEVDVAFAIAATRHRPFGTAVELDTATAIRARRSYAISPAVETDVAFALGAIAPIRITLGVAVEADLAQPFTHLGADVAYYDGPCQPWDPIWTCALPTGSEAVSGVAVQAASELLWVKSGRRFGVCEIVLRPCRDGCGDGQSVDGWWQWDGQPRPRFYQGVWTNVTCGSCTTGCSCNVVSEVTLPSPVADIVEVRIDGVVLDPSAYRVDDYRKLVRVDGGEWPDCNDLSRNDGAAGTWSVTAEVGEEIPAAGRLAAGELAVELVKAMLCDKTCALPANVTAVARAGVSQQFLNPSEINDIYDSGRIGLRLSDMFLATYNPDGLADESRVFSIDQPRPRVRTL